MTRTGCGAAGDDGLGRSELGWLGSHGDPGSSSRKMDSLRRQYLSTSDGRWFSQRCSNNGESATHSAWGHSNRKSTEGPPSPARLSRVGTRPRIVRFWLRLNPQMAAVSNATRLTQVSAMIAVAARIAERAELVSAGEWPDSERGNASGDSVSQQERKGQAPVWTADRGRGRGRP